MVCNAMVVFLLLISSLLGRKEKEKELIRRFSGSFKAREKAAKDTLRQKEAEKKAEVERATKAAAEQEQIQMELKVRIILFLHSYPCSPPSSPG